MKENLQFMTKKCQEDDSLPVSWCFTFEFVMRTATPGSDSGTNLFIVMMIFYGDFDDYDNQHYDYFDNDDNENYAITFLPYSCSR